MRLAWGTWLAAALATFPFGSDAIAQPAAPADRLPFFQDNGLPRPEVRWSDVEAVLGRPSEVARPGAAIRLEFDQGFTFEINREDTHRGDAWIGFMTIRAPATGRTPQGLYIGQPEEEATAIARATYKVLGSTTLYWGTSANQERGTSLVATNHGWRRTHSINLKFRDKKLLEMTFRVKPKPLIDAKGRDKLLGYTILIAVLFAVSGPLERMRRRLAAGPWLDRLRYALAACFAAMAALGLVAAFPALASSDPYSRWAGLIYLLLGFGGLFWAARVLVNVRNRLVAGAATVVVVLVLLAAFAMQIFEKVAG